MSKKIKFVATIQKGDGGGAYVVFPYDVEEVFGIKGRIPVKASIDGEPYQGSLIKYGAPQHMLVILKGIRAKIGKDAGDRVDVIVEHDTAKREVELPKDFRQALRENKLEAAFTQMSYSHQREWVIWIENAKKMETREKRIAKAIEKLQEKSADK